MLLLIKLMLSNLEGDIVKLSNTLLLATSNQNKYVEIKNFLVQYNINVKIICFSGIAFSALKGTQKDFFGSRYVGTEFRSKKNKYNIEKIVKAFNIKYIEIKKVIEIKKKIKEVILNKEAIIKEKLYFDDLLTNIITQRNFIEQKNLNEWKNS